MFKNKHFNAVPATLTGRPGAVGDTRLCPRDACEWCLFLIFFLVDIKIIKFLYWLAEDLVANSTKCDAPLCFRKVRDEVR